VITKSIKKREFFLRLAHPVINQCGLTKIQEENIVEIQIALQRKGVSPAERGI